jgi:hypothetical protein
MTSDSTAKKNESLAKKPTTAKLQAMDQELLNGLAKAIDRLSFTTIKGIPFRNNEIAQATGELLNGEYGKLEELLTSSGALQVNIEQKEWRDIDGDERPLRLARAAGTDMWPMGTHYWVRDNALIAGRLLGLSEFHSPQSINENLGKEMLLSVLSVMSSAAQLVRFQSIIARPDLATDPDNWPHIFLAIADNLHGAQDEGWMHIQDAWQMCVYYTLQALATGQITQLDLNQKHVTLLGLIVPFLGQVQYYHCPNAGSWEELTAIRSSVITWETKVLELILQHANDPNYRFLQSEFERYRKSLRSCWQKLTFEELTTELLHEGLAALKQQLPFESPCEDTDDPRHREGDAALLYALQLRIPDQLARNGFLKEEEANLLERKILEEVLKLQDETTGAICRYKKDSYQREGYFRNETVVKLRELYGGASGEASGADDFVERDRIVPDGREAMWLHFVFQTSAFAGRKFEESGDQYWKDLHQECLLKGLSLVTGEGEHSLGESSSGDIECIEIPPFRIPECYISDTLEDGQTIVFPSPHTPLNWAVAEALDAFSVAKRVLG